MNLESSDPSKVTATPEEGMPALEGLDKVSGGVWSMGEVFLHIKRVGSSYSFTLGKPGFLKNTGECVHSSCYLLANFHPCSWRTICCAPNVLRGIRY